MDDTCQGLDVRPCAGLERQEIDLGLERMLWLLERLGNPHKALAGRVIHVAGTNGKGSVCAFLSSVLIHAGFRVGRFTSPALVSPRDAITVNHTPISEQDELFARRLIESITSEVIKNADTGCAFSSKHPRLSSIIPTSFEYQTCIALYHFVRSQVDWAIIEVGLGGARDATNVFGPSGCPAALTIITSIGWDHVSLLGNSLQSIASEKAGIIHGRCQGNGSALCGSEQVPLVVVAHQPYGSAIVRVFEQRCSEVGARFICAFDVVQSSQQKFSEMRVETHLKGEARELRLENGFSCKALPLDGEHQSYNAAAAITALFYLRDLCIGGGTSIPVATALTDDVLRTGLLATSWPGRLTWLTLPFDSIQTCPALPCEQFSENSVMSNGELTILLDGAHNVDGIKSLRKYVNSIVQGWCTAEAQMRFSPHVQRGTDLGPARRVISSRCCSAVSTIFIFGCTQGKDLKAILEDLLFPGDCLIATTYSPPRDMGWIVPLTTSKIISIARDLFTSTSFSDVFPSEVRGTSVNGEQMKNNSFPDLGDDPCVSLYEAPTWLEALRIAITQKKGVLRTCRSSHDCPRKHVDEIESFGPPIIVCGSLYLVAEVYRWLDENRVRTSGQVGN